MNFKSVLSVFALAVASVSAVASEYASGQYCLQNNGMFLQGMDSSDTRYACLAPYKNGDENTKYCVVFDGKHLCYDPNYGNINSCKVNSWEYNGRGCSLGLGYLHTQYTNYNNAKSAAKTKCNRSKGVFLEPKNDPSDTRYGCMLFNAPGDENTKYCGVFNGYHLCYAPELGNIEFCNRSSSQYNSRGCAMSLSYLFN